MTKFLTQAQAKQQYDRQYTGATPPVSNLVTIPNAQPAAMDNTSQYLICAMALQEIQSLQSALDLERAKVKTLESDLQEAIAYIRDVLCGAVPSPAAPLPTTAANGASGQPGGSRKRTWTTYSEEGLTAQKDSQPPKVGNSAEPGYSSRPTILHCYFDTYSAGFAFIVTSTAGTHGRASLTPTGRQSTLRKGSSPPRYCPCCSSRLSSGHL